MRWDALLADLAAGLDAELAADRQAELADRIRAEYGRLRLIDRLRPSLENPAGIRLGVTGHAAVGGSLQGLGIDWLLVVDELGVQRLVSLGAVTWIRGLPGGAAEPGWEGRVGAGLTLRIVLRRLVRDLSAVTVALVSGVVVAGRLARVGADHVDLTAGLSREPSSVETWVVPVGAIAYVTRR